MTNFQTTVAKDEPRNRAIVSLVFEKDSGLISKVKHDAATMLKHIRSNYCVQQLYCHENIGSSIIYTQVSN